VFDPGVDVTRLPDCECGHPARVHEHWRASTECGTCGSQNCPYYLARHTSRPGALPFAEALGALCHRWRVRRWRRAR
jgi:hypothetical protein